MIGPKQKSGGAFKELSMEQEKSLVLSPDETLSKVQAEIFDVKTAGKAKQQSLPMLRAKERKLFAQEIEKLKSTLQSKNEFINSTLDALESHKDSLEKNQLSLNEQIEDKKQDLIAALDEIEKLKAEGA